MSQSEWSFDAVTFLVKPGWDMSLGYEKDFFEPAGVDGGFAVDNRRLPHRYGLTIIARGTTEWTTLSQLINSGKASDFEVPYADTDNMVYTGAFISGPGGPKSPVKWRKPGPDDYWEAEVTVVCPNIHPTSKLLGTTLL